jgi:hypothetical protein
LVFFAHQDGLVDSILRSRRREGHVSDSTWDDYLDSGGVDAGRLEELSDDMGSQAAALDGQVGGFEEIAEAAEAMGDEALADAAETRQGAVEDAATGLRDADWETSNAADWTAAAEREVDYADRLDAQAERHLESAADAFAQGDTSVAEWDLNMARSSSELADDSMEMAGSELGLANDDLASAATDVDLAADTLADNSMDTGLELGSSIEPLDLGADDAV